MKRGPRSPKRRASRHASSIVPLLAVPPLAAIVLAAAGRWSWAGCAAAAYGLGVLGRVFSAVATGGRSWPDALAQPASIVVFAGLVVHSFRLRRRGALTWRGRAL